MPQICNRCGGTSFHYNRTKIRMECSLCGNPLNDSQQDQQRMQFDRAYALSTEHLRAGNWDLVISLLSPYMERYPTEKKIYVAVFRAVTKDYTQFDISDITKRRIASEAWDKLNRLNGINAEMIHYGISIYEMSRKRLLHCRNTILIWIFSAAALSMLSGTFLSNNNYWMFFLFVVGMAACIYQLLKLQPIKVIRELMMEMPDVRKNPFLI